MGPVVEGLGRVGAGLRLVLLGLATTVVAAVAAMVVGATLAEPNKDPAAMLLALKTHHPGAWTLLLGLGVMASVLAIAGKAFCTSIPAEARATPFIVIAVACDVIYLALFVAGQGIAPGQAGFELTQSAPLFWIVGYLSFLRFLRRLAEYLESWRLAARARLLQLGTLALFVTAFAIVLVSGGADAAVMLAILIVIVGSLALFVLYARLVFGLRRATEAAAGDADGE